MIAPQPIPFSPDRTVQQIGQDVTNIKDALGTPPAGTIADQGTQIDVRLQTVQTAIGDPKQGPIADQLETVRRLARDTSAAIGTPTQGSVAGVLEAVRNLSDNVNKAIGVPVGKPIADRLEAVEQLAYNVRGAIGIPAQGTVFDKLDELLRRYRPRGIQEAVLPNLIRNCLARPSEAEQDTRAIQDHLTTTYNLDIDKIRKSDATKLRDDVEKSGLQVVALSKYKHFVQVLNDISES